MCTEETHRENSLFYAPNSITTSSYVAPAAATPIRYQTPTLICEAQSENLSTDCRRPGEEHVCSFARQTYNQHTHVHKFQFFKQGANPTKTAITHCHPPIPTRTITMQLDQWTLAYFSLAFDWKLIPSLEHIVGMVLVSLGWFTEGRLIFTYIPARLNRRFKVSLRITLTSNAAFSLSRPIFHSSYCFFFFASTSWSRLALCSQASLHSTTLSSRSREQLHHFVHSFQQRARPELNSALNE